MNQAHSSLSNQFLIAMPGMLDPMFAGAVVFLCEHTPEGALGLVINKPTEISMGDLFERLELTITDEKLAQQPVLLGGPVQTERGFVLHETMSAYNSSLKITDKIEMTTSKDVLEQFAKGEGPNHILVTLGYSGWSAGQLEKEILDNGWLTVEADPHILFELPAEQRHKAAMLLLGIQPMMLSSQAGHA